MPFENTEPAGLTPPHRSNRLANKTLGILGIALAVNVVMHLRPEVGSDPEIVNSEPAIPTSMAVSFALPDLGTFRVVTDRPAFAPSRRPPAPPALTVIPPAAAAPPPAPPRLTLLGTLKSGGNASAVIRPAAGRSRVMALGEVIEGWRLARIDGNLIVLENQGQRVEVQLSRRGSSPAPGTKPVWNPQPQQNVITPRE